MIALLTDFGLDDPWVGVCKGVIAALAPGVPVVDLTHGVPPQDILAGALHLDAAWRYFPPGTTFMCVVDPGVGTARRPVVVRAGGHHFVGPDNGLFSLLPSTEIREITADWGLPERSRTFHARDLFSPVAARLATGARFADVGPVVADPVRLDLPTEAVLLVDRFGNLLTDLPGKDYGVVEVEGREIPVRRAYGDVARGDLVAVTGSVGTLEIACREGNAAKALGVGRGARVRWRSTG